MNGGVIAACALVIAGATTGATEAQPVPQSDTAVNAIERYCQASWSRASIDQQDWRDCTQQVLVELLKRAAEKSLGDETDEKEQELNRELTRSIWAVAQRWRRRHQYSPLADEFVPGRDDNAAESSASEMRQMLQHASRSLTARQQEIVGQLLDGHSVTEIANDLGITTARVSDEKYKAIRKLRDQLQEA